MLEKETQHFLRCVGPLRIRVGAGWAASRLGVAGTVDIPILQEFPALSGYPLVFFWKRTMPGRHYVWTPRK